MSFFDFDIVCRDCMILIELFWGVAIVVCFEAWAWVAIVLLVSLLNLRHHQVTKWAMLELLRLLLRWRRTAACRRWVLAVRLLIFDIVCRDWMILIFVVLGCCD